MPEHKLRATGMVRRIDDLGRVVLPIEIRKSLALSSRDTVEMFVQDNAIILRKYEPTCIFCGSYDHARLYRGRMICLKCLDEIQNDKNLTD